MSLFDDDFYSSKVSVWKKRRLARSFGPMPRRSKRKIPWVLVVAAALTVVICVSLIGVLASMWTGDKVVAEPAVQPVFAGGNDAVEIQDLKRTIPAIVADVVQEMKPAIVSVINIQPSWTEQEGASEQETGSGSGIIYWREGNTSRIVTNQHVVDGASRIDVVLSDGKRFQAKLIGGDVLSDLAVLEVNSTDVKAVAEFGDSDALREGDWVVAIGHPFGLGYSPSSTWGIISSMERVIPVSLGMNGQIDWEMELLQTDAAINRGNSGGALLDMNGKVIGINSMKVSQFGVEGLGFAIPSNKVQPIIAELEQKGKVSRPYLGVATMDLNLYLIGENAREKLKLPDEVKEGIVILEAFDPSAEAGLKRDDVIVALDGNTIDSTLALRKYLYGHKQIGESIRIDYYRNGDKESVTLTLSDSPDPE